RLGLEELDLVATAVELDLEEALAQVSVRRPRYRCCLVRQLVDFLRKLVRLDDPGARRALDEAGVAEQRLVEAHKRRDALDDHLVERTQHAQPGTLAVGVPDAEL